MTNYHIPVMLRQTVEALSSPSARVLADGTLGGGGHTRGLLLANPGAVVVGFDRDADAISRAQAALAEFGERFVAVQDNFANLRTRLALLGVGHIDGLLLDLGVSSHQFDTAARGFSFREDGPLDMRMAAASGPSAADLLNGSEPAELERILYTYGEEKDAKRIVKALLRARPLVTTGQLAGAIESVTRAQHPLKACARVFQALRIAVNGELDALEIALRDGVRLLNTGGRLAVISYHSLEDRIVKQFIRHEAAACTCPPEFPTCVCGKTATLREVTRRPVEPAEDEMETNSRARSARLRVAEKL